MHFPKRGKIKTLLHYKVSQNLYYKLSYKSHVQ